MKIQDIKLKDVNFITGSNLDVIEDMYDYYISYRFNYNTRFAPCNLLTNKQNAQFGKNLIKYSVPEKNRELIICTNNDYLIDGFRLALKNSRKKLSAQLIICEGKKIYTIEILPDGQYSEKQPAFFRKWEIDFLGRCLSI